MAVTIESKRDVRYDAAELDRLRRQKAIVEQFSPWRPLLRFFLPAVLFIGGLMIIYFLIRYVRS